MSFPEKQNRCDQGVRSVRVSSSGVNSAEGFWGIDGTAAM